MATKELRELRHKYKAAYTSYMHCVKSLSDASQSGEWPAAEVLKLEEQALNDLTKSRQALLDDAQRELRRHRHGPRSGLRAPVVRSLAGAERRRSRYDW